MTDAAIADAPAPKKRGPKTPEGKARSSMNALKHGLRARSFGILPEESQAEWAEHLQDLRAGLGPVDAAEEKLVTAIAVAMWNEIRADRTLVETMAEIPPRRPGRSHGSDMHEPEHARAMGTAIRYMTATGMATQRAQRALLAHRKAKQAGLMLPAAEPAEAPANENYTNELPVAASHGGPRPAPVESKGTSDSPPAPPTPAAAPSTHAKCTNEFPAAGQLEPPGRPSAAFARAAASTGGAPASAPFAAARPAGPQGFGSGAAPTARRSPLAGSEPRPAAAA